MSHTSTIEFYPLNHSDRTVLKYGIEQEHVALYDTESFFANIAIQNIEKIIEVKPPEKCKNLLAENKLLNSNVDIYLLYIFYTKSMGAILY